MALMKHRESNQVKWVGVRPGHNGIQVAKHASATNAIAIIHTVSAGKTLFINSYAVSVDDIASGNAFFFVRDTGDVVKYNLLFARVVANGGGITVTGCFPKPLEVPAGYDVCIQSTVPSLTTWGFIHGWEE